MSEQIPTTDSVRAFYAGGRDEYDPDVVSDEQMHADFTAWIAQVRTDAAREALKRLADYAQERLDNAPTDRGADDWRMVCTVALDYIDTHYPRSTDDGR